MIQTIESPDIPYDRVQKRLQDEMYLHVETLKITSGIRFKNFQGLQGIVDGDRTTFANMATGQVDDLKDQVQKVGDSVLGISTATGSVDFKAGKKYVEQELLRESLIDDLWNWLKRYTMYKQYINATLKEKAPIGNTEYLICAETLQALQGNLSDLSVEEEILRAVTIIAEIRKQREQMVAAFYAAPIHSLKAVAASVISTIACLGVPAGVSLGIGTTGLQYAQKGYGNFRQRRKLELPDRNAKSLLQIHSYSHRTCIQECLSQCDIFENVEEVIGYDRVA